MLTDAYIELGRYAEAEASAQWMLELRPGNIPGITRAAYLLELFGDAKGALELMRQAYEGTRESETEDCAWLLTQKATFTPFLSPASGRGGMNCYIQPHSIRNIK